MSRHTYHQGDITIHYPQIQQMADTNKEQQLNTLLKEQALSILQYTSDDIRTVHMDVDYTFSSRAKTGFLSIQYQGILTRNQDAYPNNLFYTANVDMNKAATMGPSDILHADDSLTDWLLAQNIKALQAEQPALKEIVDREELTHMLTDSDSANAREQQEAALSLYIHEDKLGLSIPVIHALGDHAEYEIQLCDIPVQWRTQASVWQQCTQPANPNIHTDKSEVTRSGQTMSTARPAVEVTTVSDLKQKLKIIDDSQNDQDTRAAALEEFLSLFLDWLQNADGTIRSEDKLDPLLAAHLTLTIPSTTDSNVQNIRLISYHAPAEINGELETEYVYVQWSDNHQQLHAQLLIDGGAERLREGIVQNAGTTTSLLLGGYVSLYSPEPAFAALWQLDSGEWKKQDLHSHLPSYSEWVMDITDNEAVFYNQQYSANQLLKEGPTNSLVITSDDGGSLEAALNEQGTDLTLTLFP
ncbi:hypothetical protein [Paenibacillus wulumuqiensis]|uniref:hypothetical protein n=1 Tax=Paenibacillus wulumuqiensis TaxID=1567107 RepID=UPI00128E6F9F|nr:hypothetical protein [Paenibacillus wulumuqiensis]